MDTGIKKQSACTDNWEYAVLTENLDTDCTLLN